MFVSPKEGDMVLQGGAAEIVQDIADAPPIAQIAPTISDDGERHARE